MPVTNSNGSENLDESNKSSTSTKDENGYSKDAAPSIDFLKDERSSMTYGRRIALSLMNQKWYNPQVEVKDGVEIDGSARTGQSGNPNTVVAKPSLEKAWAYFEHFALSRYLIDETADSSDRKRAEPGENDVPTRLYSPIRLPHAQLGDFGIGIGLYFSTLRLILFLAVLCGLISIANIHFFASSSYQSPSNRDSIFPSLVQGSAICTETNWVACPSCECASDDRVTAHTLRRQDILPTSRCQVREVDGNLLTYVLKNECGDIPIYVGMINYATIILFFLVTYVYLGIFLKQQETQFDEDEQTAQDYSIQVENPPDSATDPEEWHRFFKDNFGAHATVVTCAVENDLLLHTLVERRECLRNIELMLEPGESNDELNIARKAALIERDRSFFATMLALVSKGIPEYYSRMVSLSAKVKGLAQLSYPCTNVFVTFETETAQRDVLEKMSVGIVQAEKNIKTAVADPKYLFRGEHVLYVSEPEEPSTIRWQDLNVTQLQRIKSITATGAVTFVGIVVVFIAVSAADNVSLVAGAYTITAFNVAFPILAKALTNSEPHPSESDFQTSLYFKISFFRWVNTAIVITIVTPFTNTLLGEGGLITKVYQQFFSEIVVSTALQLTDIMGHVNRHIMAPRATCQDAMNLLFKGTQWSLAERYTDMTKILFLCVWYCSIFPGAYLMCAVSLFLKYYTDKFSLLRTWERAPHLGNAIAWISHGVFFPLALVATAIMSSYYWAGFPYDNLCPVGPLEDASYGGSSFTVDGNLEEFNDAFEYEYCRQNFFGRGGIFPFVSQIRKGGAKWMTDDQELITSIFGWSSVVFSALVLIKFLIAWVKVYRALQSSSYKAVGADKQIAFSTLDEIVGYIPQISSELFSFPLIACISEEVDPELYEWNDPDKPYVYYDLTEDARKLLLGSPFDYKDGFSRIQHYSPYREPLRVENLTSSVKPIDLIVTDDGEWNSVIAPIDA
ncbi:unnamed protein product [Cylindrotheca closterium]|uniref:CSC1/OSCA1-like cytosolic domain-containing protein n=1 Tax=Cylindrotheca closterium TaxID=2856 RepID=A0AAD2CKV6_9STRA|nr:unnamed protein product [Cylindrotheca closterium]